MSCIVGWSDQAVAELNAMGAVSIAEDRALEVDVQRLFNQDMLYKDIALELHISESKLKRVLRSLEEDGRITYRHKCWRPYGRHKEIGITTYEEAMEKKGSA